jgi:hypothetical protein
VADGSLPDGFADLVPFIEWALPNETARGQRRRESHLDELRSFYDAIAPRAEAALAYLDGFPLNELPDREKLLFDLCLAYAEIAPFVEQYGRVAVPATFDERRLVPVHDK